MELKEGMYVRTKQGSFGKIIKRYEVNGYYKIIVDIRNGFIEKHKEPLFIKNLKGYSFNIIDLIEVGDYVNGKEVKHIAYFEGVEEDIPKLIFVDEHRLIPGETCDNDEIKSIVTKEQFEQMEYEVK